MIPFLPPLSKSLMLMCICIVWCKHGSKSWMFITPKVEMPKLGHCDLQQFFRTTSIKLTNIQSPLKREIFVATEFKTMLILQTVLLRLSTYIYCIYDMNFFSSCGWWCYFIVFRHLQEDEKSLLSRVVFRCGQKAKPYVPFSVNEA